MIILCHGDDSSPCGSREQLPIYSASIPPAPYPLDPHQQAQKQNYRHPVDLLIPVTHKIQSEIDNRILRNRDSYLSISETMQPYKISSLAAALAALFLLLAPPTSALLAPLADSNLLPNSTFQVPALRKDVNMPTSTFYPAVHACPASG